jgi:hypothetical protein
LKSLVVHAETRMTSTLVVALRDAASAVFIQDFAAEAHRPPAH